MEINNIKLMEEWRSVVGYEGWYSVSSSGRVRRDCNRIGNPRIRILKQTPLPKGYLRVFLCRYGKVKTFYVHRLIATSFIGVDTREVNHKDCNNQNNRLNNIEYVTSKENKQHAISLGMYKGIFGENHHGSIATLEMVHKIREEYIPYKVKMKTLAQKYNLKPGTVRAIVERRNWKNV